MWSRRWPRPCGAGRWTAYRRRKRVASASIRPTRDCSSTLSLTEELQGFPRHLSQHVGGFVITRTRLDKVVPIENAAMEDRTVIEWDKDDLEALGLSEGRCAGPRHAELPAPRFRSAARFIYGVTRDLSDQDEDDATYRMIQRADTIGVFQIESRAQMSMLPRLKPKKFYDLVIEVAIVRPGPIQGKMVHPYLQRRENPKLVVYPSPGSALARRRTETSSAQDARRAAVPGAGDAHRHRCGRLRAGRSRQAAARDGDLQARRHDQALPEQDDRRHDGEGLCSATSPNAASSRSRASANTAFRKATPRASPIWSMPRAG